MKILITGSSGYVGYIISKYFSEKGIDVVGLSRKPNHAWNGNDHFTFYPCDVTDKKKMEEIFHKEKPTHVIHLAFLMDPIHDTKREYEIDVKGSEYVMQVADSTPSVKQFMTYSSASAYGAWPDNPEWIPEEYPLRPRDYTYGIHKKEVEEYYNSFKKRKDMKMVILRMCTAVGPLYHKKGGVVSMLVHAPFLAQFAKKPFTVQFLHEDDLNALMDKIVYDTEIEGTFNFAPDSYSTLQELVPKKKFISIPLSFMRGLIRVLWFLHIAPMRPSAITLSTYGINADPSKLMKRYNYTFKYSTLTAFQDTVKKRKEKGTL